jgi:DNA N-6-adenine-methyltransferase (Dam)
MLKACAHCGCEYSQVRSHSRTCSERCKKAYGRHTRREMARNEWYSPPEVIKAARQVMGGIDLDPASCPAANEIVAAKRYFTIRDNGLSKPWAGRIWLNPPYDKFAPKFIAKFADEYCAGKISAACLLLAVHHMTTAWFEALAPLGAVYCLPSKRLKFSGFVERPTHGSVIIGIGVEPSLFTLQFQSFGLILVPYDNS